MSHYTSISSWGPIYWDWLHNLAICYPQYPSDNDSHFYYLKIKNFIETLPCKICKTHAVQYILQNYIDLSSNKNFQYWVWNFHNHVNRITDKRFFTIEEYNIKYRTRI